MTLSGNHEKVLKGQRILFISYSLSLSYLTRLGLLKIESLEERRIRTDLTEAFKFRMNELIVGNFGFQIGFPLFGIY